MGKYNPYGVTPLRQTQEQLERPMLEQQLEKDHIYLTCRHNIYELGLNFFFEACVTTSVGPKTGLFERFRRI